MKTKSAPMTDREKFAVRREKNAKAVADFVANKFKNDDMAFRAGYLESLLVSVLSQATRKDMLAVARSYEIWAV
jgi:hypothetical protein